VFLNTELLFRSHILIQAKRFLLLLLQLKQCHFFMIRCPIGTEKAGFMFFHIYVCDPTLTAMVGLELILVLTLVYLDHTVYDLVLTFQDRSQARRKSGQVDGRSGGHRGGRADGRSGGHRGGRADGHRGGRHGHYGHGHYGHGHHFGHFRPYFYNPYPYGGFYYRQHPHWGGYYNPYYNNFGLYFTF